MNAHERSEAPESQRVDVPTTTPDERRRALLDHLPARLAEDSYARYIAQCADEAREERDEARDKMFELLGRGVELEAERNLLRAELRGMKSGTRWEPHQVYLLVVVALAIIGFVVIPAIGQIVGGA